MGRKGWWSQLQSGDMPKTKTNYGDSSAANWRPERNRPTTVISDDKLTKVQKECPICGRLYWVDKECYNCGYPKNISKDEWKLIGKYLEFYFSLESGSRKPKTEAQKRFVSVCKGLLKARTIHEKAYLKYMKYRDG